MKQFLILLLSAFFVLACESSDQSDEKSSKSKVKKDPNAYASGKQEDKGSASFVVSGEHEGEYSGVAYFRSFEMRGMHSWGITLVDQKPMTFTVSFSQTGGEPIARPEVGTYTLGINPGNKQDDIFLTSFEYFESNPSKSDSYSVGIGKSSGVMEITKSTDELIEGTFSFTAERFEGAEVVGNIEVTDGKFSAVLTQ